MKSFKRKLYIFTNQTNSKEGNRVHRKDKLPLDI